MVLTSSQMALAPTPKRMRARTRRNAPECGTRWHEQRRRRSRILSSFLEILNEREPEDVSLADVAAASGVAIQTIYNLVGNRSQLISAAIEEWGNAVADFARCEAELCSQNSIMTSLQTHWSAVIAQRGFVIRTARLAFISQDIQALSWNFATQSFLLDLVRIKEAGGIAPGVHLPTLARQISYSANASIWNWLRGRYGLEDFHQDLLHGPGLMLAGSLIGDELEKLHHSLDGLRRGLPHIKPIPGMPI